MLFPDLHIFENLSRCRELWHGAPSAEKIPKSKTFTYIALIVCTAVLICFYSYPLNYENWNFVGEERSITLPNTLQQSGNNNSVIDITIRTESKTNETKNTLSDTGRGLWKYFKHFQKISNFQTATDTASSASSASRKYASLPTETGSNSHLITQVYTVNGSVLNVNEMNRTTSRKDTEGETSIPSFITVNNSRSDSSSVKKGFLVYSDHCQIPDLDPWHPSIKHLVELTPPLNCSEEYEALTKTDGNLLILDSGKIKRRGLDDISCCYRSVYRENDGETDDDVGLGVKCTEFRNKTTIRDEFIMVECKLANGTVFYKDFHSFIHDKQSVEERCSKHNESRYSIMIIGVDAVSRLNMHRQLNATAEYLLKQMDAIEMYGFNKVGDNTFPNLMPMLVGYDERELPKVCWKSKKAPLDDCDFLWKGFAKEGYRTFYAEDTPYISSFNYVKKGFDYQPTDYYFRHFIMAYEDALGRNKPINCHMCVGSISETEAVLHWMEQFASHFHDRPYFAFSWINSLTHDFLNMGSSGDGMYEGFFRRLHQSGALDRTIVIVMGDHGMRWGQIRKTYIGRLEERLPMLLIALPPKFKKDHPNEARALELNAHRLITPYDLHATLLNLLHMKNWTLASPDGVSKELASNYTRRALSLFQPIPHGRSCDDAFIEEHWCTCENSLPTDTDSNEVKKVAKFIMKNINNLLEKVSRKCATLHTNLISDARIWQPPSEHKGHTADDNIYTVVIQTMPGSAIFEGTVKVSGTDSNIELLGTISRLNLYRNQSSCIDDASLRKYCYCI